MSRYLKIKIFLIIALVLVLPFASSIAHAISFEDLVEEGKRLLGAEKNAKSLVGNSNIEITSEIQLTENGDINSNGEIDGGDTVRFSFVISNGTDKPHPFSNLKTNIKRDSIHFIHNIKGVTGIDNNTLELPNLYVLPHSKIEISFDAVLNYSDEKEIPVQGLEAKTVDVPAEKEISSSPLLEDNKKQKLSEGIKKEKKFKPAALKNGSKAILKNSEKEVINKAELKVEPSVASPSAQPADGIEVNGIATSSAQNEKKDDSN